jgi:hypothetical protein
MSIDAFCLQWPHPVQLKPIFRSYFGMTSIIASFHHPNPNNSSGMEQA